MPIGINEAEGMLNWLPHLSAVFPEAVDLAVQMTPTPFQHYGFLYLLTKSDIPSKYPRAVASLLIYLESTRSHRHFWYKADELITGLLEKPLDSDLDHQLRELAARLDLSVN